ncbi:hypothetical protein, partial [Streptomyces sp. NPDC055036]
RIRTRPPATEEISTLVAAAVDRIPALRYRVTGRLWHHRFEMYASLDPREHVEEVHCSPATPVEQCLLKATERPWLPGRPPWSVQIVSGYREDEHLLVYRVAHHFQDGLSVWETLAGIFEGGTLPPPIQTPVARGEPGFAGLRAGVKFTTRSFRPAAQWLPAESPSPRSTVNYHRTTLDQTTFDDISRATGASTAHICLAVICGALRAWTPEHWSARPARSRQRLGVPVHLPLNLRAPRDQTCLGNQVGFAPLRLPCAEPSAAQRLHRIVQHADYTELGPYRRFLASLLHPPKVVRWILTRMMALCEQPHLCVTILPTTLDIAGLGAEELMVVPTRSRHQLSTFIIVPQADTVAFHGYFQPLIRRTEHLPRLLADSLAELHTAVTTPSSSRPASTVL